MRVSQNAALSLGTSDAALSQAHAATHLLGSSLFALPDRFTLLVRCQLWFSLACRARAIRVHLDADGLSAVPAGNPLHHVAHECVWPAPADQLAHVHDEQPRRSACRTQTGKIQTVRR
jgi:hypothetical protein